MTKPEAGSQENPENILIEKLSSADYVAVIVKPGKSESRIVSYSERNDEFIIELKARPVDGKANTELLRYMKKLTGSALVIASGASSRRKVLKRI